MSRINIEGTPTFNGQVEEEKPAMMTQGGVVRVQSQKIQGEKSIIGPTVEGLERSSNVI